MDAHRKSKFICLLVAIVALVTVHPSLAQVSGAISPQQLLPQTTNLPDLSTRENVSSAMQIIVLLTVLSLAPAILIMMTSFTRIVIVLSLLRQAMGTQQLPPNQVLIGLSLFMTFLVMGPTWSKVNDTALQPYLGGTLDQKTALSTAQVPLRDFMIRQIEESGNAEVVESLLAAGAEVNLKDANGDTPLIAAIRQYLGTDNARVRNVLRQDPRVIEVLLSFRANPLDRTRDGVTAVDLARQSGNEKLISMIQRAQP